MSTFRRPLAVARRSDGDARVSTLELFFDLVFVLALTQCTALLAARPTFTGLACGIVVLALVWWSWVGYSWLTSVVNPERLSIRLPIFAVMAAYLVLSLAIPVIGSEEVWWFVAAYAVVRFGQILLFALASAGDTHLARSVFGLAGSTAIGVGLVAVGATFDGDARFAIWGVSVLLDMAGPFIFGSAGWRLVPGHFAERHGLIMIIAFGETIVAVGAGAKSHVDLGIATAAILATLTICWMWWIYFDVLAHAAEHRLAHMTPGKEQNEAARDGYSFLHLPMMCGIVLLALGLKKALAYGDEALKLPVAVALLGGASIYLLGRMGFGRRLMGTVSPDPLVAIVALLAFIPVATEVPALLTLGYASLVLTLLVIYKASHFGTRRAEVRRTIIGEGPQDHDPDAAR